MPVESFQRLDAAGADYHIDERYVGVFVKGANAAVNHVGFVYSFEDKDPVSGEILVKDTRELHFVTNANIVHKVLGPNKQYLHATLGFDEVNRHLFAGFLTAVSRKNSAQPPILYGMDWEGSRRSFDREGNYLTPNDPAGLTCSTFVSTLIDTFFPNVPFLEIDTWPKNDPEDLAWRKSKLEAYRKRIAEGMSSVTCEQVDRMEKLDPFKRLRPQQVSAAAATDWETWPVSFDRAEELAKEVVSAFASAFPH